MMVVVMVVALAAGNRFEVGVAQLAIRLRMDIVARLFGGDVVALTLREGYHRGDARGLIPQFAAQVGIALQVSNKTVNFRLTRGSLP